MKSKQKKIVKSLKLGSTDVKINKCNNKIVDGKLKNVDLVWVKCLGRCLGGLIKPDKLSINAIKKKYMHNSLAQKFIDRKFELVYEDLPLKDLSVTETILKLCKCSSGDNECASNIINRCYDPIFVENYYKLQYEKPIFRHTYMDRIKFPRSCQEFPLQTHDISRFYKFLMPNESIFVVFLDNRLINCIKNRKPYKCNYDFSNLIVNLLDGLYIFEIFVYSNEIFLSDIYIENNVNLSCILYEKRYELLQKYGLFVKEVEEDEMSILLLKDRKARTIDRCDYKYCKSAMRQFKIVAYSHTDLCTTKNSVYYLATMDNCVTAHIPKKKILPTMKFGECTTSNIHNVLWDVVKMPQKNLKYFVDPLYIIVMVYQKESRALRITNWSSKPFMNL
jgi:hypothetical protein